MFNNAKWIFDKECPLEASPIFRKYFSIKEDNPKAKINICGVGFYILKINDKIVSDELLTPPITAYDKTLIYQTYDISDLIDIGENEILITLGNGLYNENTVTAWNFQCASWRGRPRLIFNLEIRNSKGELIDCLISDSSWECSTSKTVFNSLREGETCDANAEYNWHYAKIAPSPGGILKPQALPPVRVAKIIEGKKIFDDVYDFGINITGNAEIEVEGKRGSCIELHYSERINSDGTLDIKNIGAHTKSDRFATDKYILAGKDVEKWHSNFGYHGFRYVKVVGDANLISIKARCFHTDIKDVGNYTTDNDRINQLHSAVRQSMLNNFVHYPLDCPHREKNGWTGDMSLSCYQAMMNFDMTDALLKWLDDIVDAQRLNGAIPAIAPTGGVFGYEVFTGPTWDSALVNIVWQLYVHTGRIEILERYANPIRKYIEFLDSISDNDIWYIGLGDWCSSCSEEHACRTEVLLTAVAYNIYQKASQIFDILNDASYVENLVQRTMSVKKQFLDTFELNVHSQTELALALYYGLTDEKEKIFNKLCELVVYDDFHIRAGIFGAMFVPQVLSENGRFDLAWRIITREGYPGWMHMLGLCSGTLGENWKCTTSLDHHMFSSVDCFVWNNLIGLKIDSEAQKAKHITLIPHFPDDINHFSAWHETAFGKITIEYNGNLYKVVLPENCTGTLNLNGDIFHLASNEQSFIVNH